MPGIKPVPLSEPVVDVVAVDVVVVVVVVIFDTSSTGRTTVLLSL